MMPAVKATAVFLTIAVIIVWIAGRRSHEQAETSRRQARVRGQARARAAAGMPPGHPEDPSPPDLCEHLAYGTAYAAIAAELADIEVTGGQP
jgi:hypothetical protein